MQSIGTNLQNHLLSLIKPNGASIETAKSENTGQVGIVASLCIARRDQARVLSLKYQFEAVGNHFNIPPALLAAIASRESHCGAILDKKGWGDNGNAFGLFQIDKRAHTILGQQNPQGELHINQATGILADFLAQIERKHPAWSEWQTLKGAVAAYNAGVKNIQTLDGMDIGTTHNDYSNDIWARAQYFTAF